MATADSVKAKIQGLIDTSNATTGQNDTTLTDAVNHLKDGYGQGGDSEMTEWWNDYLNNGGNFNQTFANISWTDKTYNPPDKLVCTKSANSMFNNAKITTTKVPIELRCSDISYMFTGCSDLVTIVLLGFYGVTTSTSVFTACSALKHLTVEGEIKSGLGFTNCANLTNESVQSIIDHLKNLTGLESKKVTFHATVLSKMTEEQLQAIKDKNWTVG